MVKGTPKEFAIAVTLAILVFTGSLLIGRWMALQDNAAFEAAQRAAAEADAGAGSGAGGTTP